METPDTPPLMYDPRDWRTEQQRIFTHAKNAFSGLAPVRFGKHELALENVDYAKAAKGPKSIREAIMQRGTLGRTVKGDWVLRDAESGQELERRTTTLARVPTYGFGGQFVLAGTPYSMSVQQRLRAGVFARETNDGNLESHINVAPGTGSGQKFSLDPKTGVFRLKVAGRQLPAAALFGPLGITQEDLQKAWGPDLAAINWNKQSDAATKKLHKLLVGSRAVAGADPVQEIRERLAAARIDRGVAARTLGLDTEELTKDVYLNASRRLVGAALADRPEELQRLGITRTDLDDRDAIYNTKLMTPATVIAERISRLGPGLMRNALRAVSRQGSLAKMQASLFDKTVRGGVTDSGLGQVNEAPNPLALLDNIGRITRMGTGGIPSDDAIPIESRAINGTTIGIIDGVVTPESGRVGVDLRLSRVLRYDDNGRMYVPMRSPITGKETSVPVDELAGKKIVIPGQKPNGKHNRVNMLLDGKMVRRPLREADYVAPAWDNSFSPSAHLVPMKNLINPQRGAMGARMLTQAVNLVNPEAPLVRTMTPEGDRSFEEVYGDFAAVTRADGNGVVTQVTPEKIVIDYGERGLEEVEIANMPLGRKAQIQAKALVQPGDRVTPGQLLTKSNFTDDDGALALGVNAHVGYMVDRGYNYEDAISISESFSKRLRSQHASRKFVEALPDVIRTKAKYVGAIPGEYSKAQLDKLGDDGVIQIGQQVKKGDPLVLGFKVAESRAGHVRGPQSKSAQDLTLQWKSPHDGEVLDVQHGRDGINVVVGYTDDAGTATKLANRYGGKGVISHVIPDEEMPQGEDGKPLDILVHTGGIISRGNPAQYIETVLGGVAHHLGEKFVGAPAIEDTATAEPDAILDDTIATAKKAGFNPWTEVTDPVTGIKIPTLTGRQFFMKLKHMPEDKVSSRGIGAYDATGAPSRGGEDSAKTVGMLQVNALLSHNAYDLLRETRSVRGQQALDRWSDYIAGRNPSPPKVPKVFEKFVSSLQAAGIRPVRNGTRVQLTALPEQDVVALSRGREIKNGDTFDWAKDMRPLEGGLFDPALTGGPDGDLWSMIRLPEPLPNPIMEEPIRRVLDLTEAKFNSILAGDEPLGEYGTGAQAIAKALESIDLESTIEKLRKQVRSVPRSRRDTVVRKLKFLQGARDSKLHPRQWMTSAVPVLPPKFRPISKMPNSEVALVDDANYMYRDLLQTKGDYESLKGRVSDLGDERVQMYKSFKALVGLGDPVGTKTVQAAAKGVLANLLGDSPKRGMLQRRILGGPVDLAGRATVVPDPELGMDEIALPQKHAMKVFGPMVARQLVARGMSPADAVIAVEENSPRAKELLVEEMARRPVYMTRDPILHRFGVMGFRAKLSPEKSFSIHVNPFIVKGQGMDFDGDTASFHVPTTDAGIKDVLRMLPSAAYKTPENNKPIHLGVQEFMGGLYAATTAKPKSRAGTREFRTHADLLAAFNRGEIRIDEPVVVLGD